MQQIVLKYSAPVFVALLRFTLSYRCDHDLLSTAKHEPQQEQNEWVKLRCSRFACT